MRSLVEEARKAQLELDLAPELELRTQNCRNKIKSLLVRYGSPVDTYSNIDSRPFEFIESVKYLTGEKVKFILESDDLNPDEAIGLSVSIPILGRTLLTYPVEPAEIRTGVGRHPSHFTNVDALRKDVAEFSEFVDDILSQFPVQDNLINGNIFMRVVPRYSRGLI